MKTVLNIAVVVLISSLSGMANEKDHQHNSGILPMQLIQLADSVTQKEREWAIAIAEKAKGNYQVPTSKIEVVKDQGNFVVIYVQELPEGASKSGFYLKYYIDKQGKILLVEVPK
jgi:hypothetical protein